MGKRILAVLFSTIMIASLAACGKANESANQDELIVEPVQVGQTETEQAAPEEQEAQEVPADTNGLPYGTDEGTGTMYLATAGGTTEDGNVPDVLVSKDTSLLQIEIRTSDFDRSSFSFVYY